MNKSINLFGLKMVCTVHLEIIIDSFSNTKYTIEYVKHLKYRIIKTAVIKDPCESSRYKDPFTRSVSGEPPKMTRL